MTAEAPINAPHESLVADAETPRATRSPSRWSGVAARYALVGVFAAIVVLFSILKSDTYPTADTWQAIASTQAVIALLALSALLPLIVGQFDVSIGFQLGLSQSLCAGLIIRQGLPAGEAAVIAVAACGVVGLINGLLVTKVRLTSFIATLAVGTLVLGFTQLYSKDETISGALPTSFTNLGQNKLLGLPLPLVFVLVFAAVIWVAFEYTSWGRECHATGGSPRAALLAGVRTDRVTIECFVLAGTLAGLAGVLSVMMLGASSPVVGLGELLPAFAGAFLGATAIRPGRFNAVGTVLAVYLLAAGITGLQQLGAAFYVQQLFNGGALLIALSLAALVGRGRSAATA
jgi:ribose transport system permease protein